MGEGGTERLRGKGLERTFWSDRMFFILIGAGVTCVLTFAFPEWCPQDLRIFLV